MEIIMGSQHTKSKNMDLGELSATKINVRIVSE